MFLKIHFQPISCEGGAEKWLWKLMTAISAALKKQLMTAFSPSTGGLQSDSIYFVVVASTASFYGYVVLLVSLGKVINSLL